MTTCKVWMSKEDPCLQTEAGREESVLPLTKVLDPIDWMTQEKVGEVFPFLLNQYKLPAPCQNQTVIMALFSSPDIG